MYPEVIVNFAQNKW